MNLPAHSSLRCELGTYEPTHSYPHTRVQSIRTSPPASITHLTNPLRTSPLVTNPAYPWPSYQEKERKRPCKSICKGPLSLHFRLAPLQEQLGEQAPDHLAVSFWCICHSNHYPNNNITPPPSTLTLSLWPTKFPVPSLFLLAITLFDYLFEPLTSQLPSSCTTIKLIHVSYQFTHSYELKSCFHIHNIVAK